MSARASSTWMDQVKAHGVEAVARVFGVTVVGKGRSVGIACPACGAEQRGSADRRGAGGLRHDDAGWQCHRCQAKGSALDVAMWRALGREASGAEDWRRVQTECASHGLCDDLPGAPPRAVPVVRQVPAPRVVEPHDHQWAPTVGHVPGDAMRTWEAYVDNYLAPCGGCPECVDGRGQCSTRPANPARDWLAKERGFPVDAYLGSGVATATLELLDTWPEHARGWVRGQLKERGPALLAPMRNARTNVVEALALRFTEDRREPPTPEAPEGKPLTPKIKTVAGLRQTAEDGTPRGYGWAGACLRADLLVVVEGLTDTLAAEALLWPRHGAEVVGSISADTLPHWARILVERRHGHVVVIPDLDKPKGATIPTADGKGQDKATDLVRELRGAGVAASIFHPVSMLKRLRAGGLPVDEPMLGRIKDLADMVHECAAANIPWTTLRAAFHDTLDEVTRG